METTKQDLRDALNRVQSRIDAACDRANRPSDGVMLLPVTKTHSTRAIGLAYDLGLREFGENRVQELVPKQEALPTDIHWHLIGHLQSNKAKQVVPFVSLIHGLDSIETATELSRRAGEAGRKVDVLVEVNISGETAKHGVFESEAEELVLAIADRTANISCRGLMGVASFEEDVERTRPQFARLRMLRDRIRQDHPELLRFAELSMGMSNDFEVAIEEGATIVRIGSALFGPRD